MSADIWLVNANGDRIEPDDLTVDDELAEMHPLRESSKHRGGAINLTYNLSPMLWGAGMPAWSDMMGMRASEAGLIWEAVVDELKRDPDFYQALNPDNGWGTYDEAVETLAYFAGICALYPDATVGGWL